MRPQTPPLDIVKAPVSSALTGADFVDAFDDTREDRLHSVVSGNYKRDVFETIEDEVYTDQANDWFDQITASMRQTSSEKKGSGSGSSSSRGGGKMDPSNPARDIMPGHPPLMLQLSDFPVANKREMAGRHADPFKFESERIAESKGSKHKKGDTVKLKSLTEMYEKGSEVFLQLVFHPDSWELPREMRKVYMGAHNHHFTHHVDSVEGYAKSGREQHLPWIQQHGEIALFQRHSPEYLSWTGLFFRAQAQGLGDSLDGERVRQVDAKEQWGRMSYIEGEMSVGPAEEDRIFCLWFSVRLWLLGDLIGRSETLSVIHVRRM